MRVWLTRKFARRLDGVDLSQTEVGELMDVPTRDGNLLIAEGWAAPERRQSTIAERAVADDSNRHARRKDDTSR